MLSTLKGRCRFRAAALTAAVAIAAGTALAAPSPASATVAPAAPASRAAAPAAPASAVPPTASTSGMVVPAADPAAGAMPSASPRQAAAMPAASPLPAASKPGAQLDVRPACSAPVPGQAQCLALIDSAVHWTGLTWAARATAAAKPRGAARPPAPSAARNTASSADTPEPFMAADLQNAYRLPSGLLGARQTIAIVDAYDDPNAEADLAVYRAANDLPPCGADFGCFEKVNQRGVQGDYPPVDIRASWEVEESLDLDMASAICPNCKIILVEADDATLDNLGASVTEAVSLGATVISNSYGAAEYNGEAADCQKYFAHQGVAITASAGDAGFGTIFPSVCQSVTAVGGTSLYPDSTARGWSEATWSGDWAEGTGGGCSALMPKPSWQHDTLCGKRTTADVSAVADPSTPVAMYDTYHGVGGWLAVGGTSVSAPLIAGVYALAGNTAATGTGASYAYAHRSHLFDVTGGFEGLPGTNGECGGSYLCTAGPGYDGPTGLGTPDGIGAF